jgi:hypothetical protein
MVENEEELLDEEDKSIFQAENCMGKSPPENSVFKDPKESCLGSESKSERGARRS